MVIVAWRWIYGSWPSWKEIAAICVHDWGYWGCAEMDGEDGIRHPEFGATIADNLLGEEYGNLVRGHSKGYADRLGVALSKLYAPDKLSHVFELAPFYVLRTRLTGELGQYRGMLWGRKRVDDVDVSDANWFRVVRLRMARGGLNHAIETLAPNKLGEHRGR
jgi:hypothetical protein